MVDVVHVDDRVARGVHDDLLPANRKGALSRRPSSLTVPPKSLGGLELQFVGYDFSRLLVRDLGHASAPRLPKAERAYPYGHDVT